MRRFIFIGSLMNNVLWKILCWNVRGINSDKKWDSIRDKIKESNCDIICLQETKRENSDQHFLKKLCPPSFDAFEFLPSIGASGELLLFGNHICFRGVLLLAMNLVFQWNLHQTKMG